jgi:hypothetical protein
MPYLCFIFSSYKILQGSTLASGSITSLFTLLFDCFLDSGILIFLSYFFTDYRR